MYVCVCRSVTDTHIQQEVQQGATSLRDLNKQLGVGSQCGRCGRCAKKVLKEALREQECGIGDALPVPA